MPNPRFAVLWLMLMLAPGFTAAAEAAATNGRTPAADAARAEGAAALSPADLDALARDLDDPQARARLAATLRALAAARRLDAPAAAAAPAATASTEAGAAAPGEAAPPPAAADEQASSRAGSAGSGTTADGTTSSAGTPLAPPADAPATPRVTDATAQLLDAVARRIGTVGEDVGTLAGNLVAAQSAAGWLVERVRDPLALEETLAVLKPLALVMLAGYAAFAAVWLLFRGLHRAIGTRTPAHCSGRLLWSLLRLVIEGAQIAALYATAMTVLTVLDPKFGTRLLVLVFIHAAVIVRSLMALARVLLAPDNPGLRLLPCSDEAAKLTQRWLRRLVLVPVYAYLALQAARLLGLPWGVHDAVLRLIGLYVAVQVIVLILSVREPVGALIRKAGGQRLRLFTVRVSRSWHWLAIIYVTLMYAIWALAVEGGFLFLLRASVATLVAILIVRYGSHGVRKGLRRLERRQADLRQRRPESALRVGRAMKVLRRLARVLLLLAAVLLLLEGWNVDAVGWLTSPAGQVLLAGLARITAVVLGALLVWELAGIWIEEQLTDLDRHGRQRIRSARARTLLTVGRKAVAIFVVTIAVLLVLSELGVNIGPLLAGAGVVGVAVGFGAQKLVQDVITGAFILMEDVMAVGDVVNVGGQGGLVEAISLRYVRLRDLAGTVHTIPFSSISTVSNLTKDYSYYVFDVSIGYAEDVERVCSVLTDIDAELRRDEKFGPMILEPLEILGVDQFADSAVVVKARTKTQPIQQWNVGREFNKRLKQRFGELGIEIPFPQRTVHVRAPAGTPPDAIRAAAMAGDDAASGVRSPVPVP